MIEIIYVDTKRLDSYVEQLGSPNTFDSIPIWGANLSLLGPSAGATQQRPIRKLTQIEQIRLVIRKLSKKGWVSMTSPTSSDQIWGAKTPAFCIDSFNATRVFLPPQEGTNFEGIMLWIARYDVKEKEDGLIIMMENVNTADQKKQYLSSYSEFLLFSSYFEPQLLKTKIKKDFFHPNNEKAFLNDPISSFIGAGAQAIDKREITVLYRIRVATEKNKLEIEDKDGAVFTTIAYPIVIAQGNVKLN